MFKISRQIDVNKQFTPKHRIFLLSIFSALRRRAFTPSNKKFRRCVTHHMKFGATQDSWVPLARKKTLSRLGKMVRSTIARMVSQNARRKAGREQKWIDSLRIYCVGGHGGNGLPKYGGCGGQGGSIFFQATQSKDTKQSTKAAHKRANANQTDSLYGLFKSSFKLDPSKQKVIADAGENSSRYKIVGQVGKDVTLNVPKGVYVKDDSGNLLGQLDKSGDKILIAQGGSGGAATNGFLGQPGQKRFVRLDYKVIADLGLVGFPNAGKSTLLKAISQAKPKIASYPFTTIKPNLGQILYNDQREISMADLPGLIEGAHYNVGMGHQFLKHVERTSILLFVVAIDGFQLNPNSAHRSAYETVALLNKELELYNPDILLKPAICLINKMDVEGADEKLEMFMRHVEDSKTDPHAGLSNLNEDQKPEQLINFLDVVPMSAKFSQKSVVQVKDLLRTALDDLHSQDSNELVAEASKKLDLMISDTSPKLY